jgi:hypothetical protein
MSLICKLLCTLLSSFMLTITLSTLLPPHSTSKSPILCFRPTLVSELSPINPYDPFELVKPQKPFIRYPKTSPYFAKEPPHNLFIVESDFSLLKPLPKLTFHLPSIFQQSTQISLLSFTETYSFKLSPYKSTPSLAREHLEELLSILCSL